MKPEIYDPATDPATAATYEKEIKIAHLTSPPPGSLIVYPLSDEDIGKVNPGIRSTVQRLRNWSFQTCDSGDGETRDYECDRGFPYVDIAISPGLIETEIHRLIKLLTASGINFDNRPDPQVDEGGWKKHPAVEASYQPLQCTHLAFLHVSNIILP